MRIELQVEFSIGGTLGLEPYRTSTVDYGTVL